MNDKLTSKEKIEIAIQSGLQLVPYIGPSLSSLYFGNKQEKRFKRIESFYQELSEKITNSDVTLPTIDNHNKDELMAIIEELNEKIEREHSNNKRNYFKNYMLSTLSKPKQLNFDVKRFFLDILGSMTLLESHLLLFILENPNVRVGSIKVSNTNQYAIVGSVGRLKNYGLLSSSTTRITIGSGDNSLNENVSVSSFGKDFIKYCLID